tara:strand:- start:520 stop:756 length:237 start_codon:yes stop_codon:yes gene_type:complete
MKCCEACGVNPRFRKISSDAYQLKAEKLEIKYKLNIEQAREANARLRSKLNAQLYTIKALRRHITTHCLIPVREGDPA